MAGWPRPIPLLLLPTLADDLARVEDQLRQSVQAEDPFLTEVASHLIIAGGKRVRPAFCVTSAATRAATMAAAPAEVISGAVSVELVHLGSLYHDDVMDDATTRRTVESVNARWGNLKAILAGDYLLARASEIAASLGTEVAGLLASTIARLCEGQVLELQHTFDVGRTEEAYLASIDGKTASLLATACRIGGIVGDLPRPAIDALTQLRPQLRHGLPDRRRHPRRRRHRRGAGQALGPRPGRGRLHPAGHPGAGRRWPRRRPARASCSAVRSTAPSLDEARAIVRGSGAGRRGALATARDYADQAAAALADVADTEAGAAPGRRVRPPARDRPGRRRPEP